MIDNARNRAKPSAAAPSHGAKSISRRRLIAQTGAAGVMAAAALQETMAQNLGPTALALADPHIVKQDITYPSDGGGAREAQVRAYLASPKSHGPRGGIIVIHEIFGLTDHIKSIACRLAEAGFTALAPDLFTREGAPPPMSGGFQALGQFVSAIPDAQIMADLDAAARRLRHEPDSNSRVGVVGFCYGGRLSMLYDAHAPNLSAAVAFYGRVSGEKSANQPEYPIDVVAKMHAPLLAHFGAEDKSIPPAEAQKLWQALEQNHKTGAVHEYANAGHAFNNDTRETYRPEAAKLAWSRTIAWFDKYVHSASRGRAHTSVEQ